jgi:hypothetical protein
LTVFLFHSTLIKNIVATRVSKNAKINIVNSSPGVTGRSIEHQLERPLASTSFEIIFTLLSAWLVSGLFLDGWAHFHVAALETFFTPWHAVLYSGFLALASFIGLTLGHYHRQGYPWQQAIPAGYKLSFWGIIIFGLSGLGDMSWHLIFGIERGIEALVSPTHLGLITGVVLMVGGPFRAAWQRPGPSTSGLAQLPSLLSLTFILAVLNLTTYYAHPLVAPAASQRYFLYSTRISQELGLVGFLLQVGLLAGLLLLVIRRWPRLPAGFWFTPVIGLSSIGLSFMEDTFDLLPGMILAGITIDLLYRLLQPSVFRPAALRLFAAAAPILWSTLYFLNLILSQGSWWSVHLISGAIFLTGIIGWLLSYLVVPPAIPGEASQTGPDAGAG